MSHLWLVGMMGSGKTTVGAIIAERLGRPVADTDSLVMQAEGRTIPELFADSEEQFRSAERKVIASFAEVPSSVIATGGGAVLDDRNTAIMKELGTIVLLTATVEELASRLGKGDRTRPLLADEASLERIASERAERYAAVADAVVDTSSRTPHEVAEDVLACVSI